MRNRGRVDESEVTTLEGGATGMATSWKAVSMSQTTSRCKTSSRKERCAREQ